MGRDRRNERSTEHWTKMLRRTMEYPAWRALSPTAQALYPWLKFEWHGPDHNNNGRIRLSVRQAAARLGIRPDTAARAFRDLQAKGFIVQTERPCLGTTGEAKSPAFELTELALPHGRPEGRKLFADWHEGAAFEAPKAMANNPRGANGKTKPCHQNRDGPVLKSVTK